MPIAKKSTNLPRRLKRLPASLVRRTVAFGKKVCRRLPHVFFLVLCQLPTLRKLTARQAALFGIPLRDYNKTQLGVTVDLIPSLVQGNQKARAAGKKHTDIFFTERSVLAPEKYVVAKQPSCTLAGAKLMLLAVSDPEKEIVPYVRHYIESMRRLCGYSVILTADFPPRDEDLSLFDAVVVRTCAGYDFTSWKAAFAALPELYDAAEVLLTNDSIFAPIGDISVIHKKMEEVPCDFWGLAESSEIQPHLQSYYLVLKKKTLASDALKQFWEYVPITSSRERAIQCELTLSLWLAQNGLQPGAYLPAKALPAPSINPSHAGWELCLDVWQTCFLKRDLLLRNVKGFPMDSWKEKVRQHGYPVELIVDYTERMERIAKAKECENIPPSENFSQKNEPKS